MPIALAPINRQLKIVKIIANEDLKRHLESLGITLDGTLTILSSSGGTVICLIKEGRVALDRDLSTKIFVTEIN